MSYLLHLKRTKMHPSERWIVKTNDKSGKIREVKLIFNPEEYQNTVNTFTRKIEIYQNGKCLRIVSSIGIWIR